MRFSRRDFLRSTLVACAGTVPLFLARSAGALANQSNRPNRGHILVVVQLDGGNDGLNTVVPFQDDDYHRSRPQLAIAARDVQRLDDRTGLHPAMIGLRRIFENQQLAIVQSVGYPNPNRSHFESMAIWQTARLDAKRETTGWLARLLDLRFNGVGDDASALHVGETLVPQALHGSKRHVPSLADLDQFRRRLGIEDAAQAREQRAALDRIGSSARGEAGSLLQFVEQTSAITYASSARLEEIARTKGAGASYPESFGLARQLKLIAQLIKADLQTSIYYTQMTGFDTHANQLNTHRNLLAEVSASLKAFLDDLHGASETSRVMVLVFSEFGGVCARMSAGAPTTVRPPRCFYLGRLSIPVCTGPSPTFKTWPMATRAMRWISGRFTRPCSTNGSSAPAGRSSANLLPICLYFASSASRQWPRRNPHKSPKPLST
jgi:uncharacterized protein (DUF1501 family)